MTHRVVVMPDATWSGAMLLARGATTVLSEYVGEAEPGFPIEETTRFQAGAVSGQLLSVIILQLVDQEVLSLHEPVQRWVVDLPEHWQDLTLHQLLRHTSGLAHWSDVVGLDRDHPPVREVLEQMIIDTPAAQPPDTGFRFSGIGLLLATRVAEAVTASPWSDLVHQLVVDRVGMARTTSGIFPVGQRGVAYGLRHGRPLEVAAVATAVPGSGDLWTTATDLVRFGQALRADLLPDRARHLIMADPVSVTRQPYEDAGIVLNAAGYGTFAGSLQGHTALLALGRRVGYLALLAWLPDLDADLAILSNDDGHGLEVPLRRALAALG